MDDNGNSYVNNRICNRDGRIKPHNNHDTCDCCVIDNKVSNRAGIKYNICSEVNITVYPNHNITVVIKISNDYGMEDQIIL